MLVRVEELGGLKRKLTIGLAEADVRKKAKELLAEAAKDAKVPGFRQGKVPAEMLEKKHGPATMAEALRILAGGAYADAVREADIHPVCDPVVELDEEVKDGNYTLTATVEVRPEVELKEYEGLEFTERIPVVSNDDVEKYLEGLREERAELLPVTRPSVDGDIVVLDYEPLGEDGAPMPDSSKHEDYVCELGKGQVPPEIEEALRGVTAGDEKTVAVRYPDDFRVQDIAGKEISFNVTVKDVRQKRLPVVNDDFAKACGPFETLLDLRVRIRSGLEAQAKSWARRRLEEEVVRELIQRNPVELPECLVENRLRLMYSRTQRDPSREAGDNGPEPDAEVELPEEFVKVYTPVVEHQLRAGLLLGKLAEKQGLEVTREDIEERIGQIAEAQGHDASALMSDLAGTDAISQIEDEIWLEKIHEHLIDVSNIKTETFEPQPEQAEAAPDAGSE